MKNEVSAPATPPKLASLSFAPFAPDSDAEVGGSTSEAQIRADLDVVAPYTRAIRTYASTGGLELVPPLAAEHDLKVTVGAWIDKDDERNEKEISAAVDLAKKNPNVTSIVVGNETIMRDDKTPEELIDYIRRVKQETGKPVTTGEVWHVWLQHPELVAAVDYIAVHILPYWEGQPAESTVDRTVELYNKLRSAYPGKHIVIAEFGWPSAGYNRLGAYPGAIAQASVIRGFIARANALGIDYNLVEALDQPWKVNEGSVGAYWGLFDGNRQLKFPLVGPIEDRRWFDTLVAALLFGLLLSLPLLRVARPTVLQAFVISSAANGVGAWAALMLNHWVSHYFTIGAAIAMVGGSILLVPLAVTLLARIEELASVAFGRGPGRLVRAREAAAAGLLPSARQGWRAPKVSIHIPAYREPPEMLKRTLDSIARLDYPNLECIVAINNTPDPAFTDPIEEHCKALGDRFKFLNLQNVKGFKAGALRIALEHTAPDAEVIGILDADYTVTPNWLADLVPLFDDPTVGLVQAPQDHRDGGRSVMHSWMNTEYAGFFDIGMVQRNEHDAIVTHGTMLLIRRAAMEQAGNWSSDTICEDTDLGLKMMEAGWRAHYTNERYGHGLLPDEYEAFKKQRHRWAFGGTQIATKHLRDMFSSTCKLTADQRREYLVGWLNWLGAESVGVVIAILNLLWVPVVAFGGIAIPEMVLTLPVVASFAIYLVHFFVLYGLRVRRSKASTIGAAVTAMSLQLTVAKAVGEAVVKQHMPFIRTDKGGKRKKAGRFPAFWEAVMAGLLIGGAVLLDYTNVDQIREINLFALVLTVQSLPFLAAVAVATLERLPINDYAVLARVTQRLGSIVGVRRRTAPPPTAVDA